MREKQANRRIRLLLGVFVARLRGVLARAVWLQVVHGGALREPRAEPAPRDAEDRRPAAARSSTAPASQLAIGEQTTTVFADPQQVRNARAVARAAHDVLGVDANVLYPQLLNKKSAVRLRASASPTRRRRRCSKKRSFAGLGFYPEERRTYPQGSVGAQVIGYAGVDNKGLDGLELQYDRKLAGRPGSRTIVRDGRGQAIDVISSLPEQKGADVFTTLDHTIQAQAEAVLRQTVANWGAKDATAIVLDPTTGEVLAMAQAPGYDANNASNVAARRSSATARSPTPTSRARRSSSSRSPASLSEGLVTPTTRVHAAVLDPGRRPRSSTTPRTRGTETLSVAQILEYSSNVGAVTLAEKLGATAARATGSRQFGFGQPTGIDFPGESAGLVLPLEQWSGSTIGNVPIGQGISVTPIQMASVYAAVANGGVWMQPHLVDARRRPRAVQRRRSAGSCRRPSTARSRRC